MQLGEVTFRMNLPFPNSFLFLVVRPGAPLVASLLLNIEHRIHFATFCCASISDMAAEEQKSFAASPQSSETPFWGLSEAQGFVRDFN